MLALRNLCVRSGEALNGFRYLSRATASCSEHVLHQTLSRYQIDGNRRHVSAQTLPTPKAVSEEAASQQQQLNVAQSVVAVAGPETPLTTAEEPRKISAVLLNIEAELNRMQLVFRRHLEDFFAALSPEDVLSEYEADFLLKACGEPMSHVKVSERTEFLDRIWKLLPKHGIQYSTRLYNRRFSVQIENGLKSSSVDLLTELKTAGLNPDTETYELVITLCCNGGDLLGATKVVEKMKKQNVAVTEKVFGALAHGYAKLGKEENTKEVLEVMKGRGLNPTQVTYRLLLRAYAERGDMDNMRSVMQNAELSKQDLTDKDLLDAIYVLCVNGHGKLVNEVLTRIRKSPRYNSLASTLSVKLAAAKQFDGAYQVNQTLPRFMSERSDGTGTSDFGGGGNRLISQVLRYEIPGRDVLDFCKYLKAERLNNFADFNALKFAFRIGDVRAAEDILCGMYESNVQLRPYYFWPMFCQKQVRNDLKALCHVLETMSQCRVMVTYETMLNWFWKNVPPKTSFDDVVDLLQRVAVNPSVLFMSYLENALRLKDIDALRAFAKRRWPTLNNPERIARNVSLFLNAAREYDFAVELVQKLSHRTAATNTAMIPEDFRMVFLNQLSTTVDDQGVILETLQCMKKKGVGLDQTSVAMLRNGPFGQFMLDKKIEDAVNDLQCLSPQDDLEGIDIQELIKLHNTEGRDVGRRCSGLMEKCMKENDASGAMQVYDFVKDAYPDIAASAVSSLIMFLVKEGRVSEAKTVYNTRPTGFPSPRLNIIMELAKGLLRARSTDLAIDLMRSYRSTEAVDYATPRSGQHSVALYLLIDTATDMCSAAECCRMLEALYVYGFLPNSSSPLIRSIALYASKLQFENAVAVFEDASLRYRRLPFANQLMELLIERENSALLQRVFDVVARRRGEHYAITMLALALVSEQRLKQAEQLFSKPGVVIDEDQLSRFCRSAVEKEQLPVLEAITQVVSKRMDRMDRDVLYSYWLTACRNAGDYKSALRALQAMKAESLTPSSRNLALLTKIFTENSQPLPSDLPSASSVSEKETEAGASGEFPDDLLNVDGRSNKQLTIGLSWLMRDSEVIARIRQGQIEEAVKMVEELRRKGARMSLLVPKMLIQKYAQDNDLQALRKLQSVLLPFESRMLKLSQAILTAAINKGEYEQVIRNVTTRPTATVSSALITQMLQKNGELESRIAVHAETAYKLGNPCLKISLWLHYLIANRDADAKAILDQVGREALLDHIRYFYLADQARSLNRPDLVEKALNAVKSLPPSYRLSSMYSLAIATEISRRNADRAKELMAEAKATGNTTNKLIALLEQRLQRISAGDESAFTEKVFDDDELQREDAEEVHE